MILAEDETDLLLFPPLRAAWGRRGESTEVVLSGRNARRVLFGTINLRTGKRLFLVRKNQKQEDFHAFLRVLHWHYRGWRVSLLLDGDSSHTAGKSRDLAELFQINLIWLPKRSPELNPMDHLWGQGKDVISANQQRETIEDHVDRYLEYLESLSAEEALQTSGVRSEDFWLKSVL